MRVLPEPKWWREPRRWLTARRIARHRRVFGCPARTVDGLGRDVPCMDYTYRPHPSHWSREGWAWPNEDNPR